MVIAWIGYCVLVSALLALAALASERALGHFRKPVRWVWFAAILGSLAAPATAFLAPGLFPGNAAAPVPPLAGAAVLADPASAAPVVDPLLPQESAAGLDLAAVGAVLGWVWALLVLAMLVHLTRVYRRLRLEMRAWTPGQVLGESVMISDDRGPAVVGLARSVVVMPKWISALEDRLLRLVFLHEREHQRAGDHRLFTVGIAALVLMPWNPFLWWQVSRLRLVIEFDCDRRVLIRGESPQDYADALIAVGGRVSAPLLTAAAFAERKPAVERRLRRMTAPPARRRVLRSLGASGVAMLAIVFLLGCPTPENSLNAPEPPAAATTPSDALEGEPPAASRAEAGSRAERPTFIPFDTDPVLQNAREVMATLEAAYPEDLKAAGMGGRAELWLYLDESGVVRNQEIKTPSGHDALDLAATEVVRTMRFDPATNRGQTTDVWVSQWVTFQVVDDVEPDIRSETPRADANAGRGETIIVEGVVGPDGQSVSSADDPLIVIDGVIQPEDVTIGDVGLEELDIDNVEVLAGERAVEEYGERARRGVLRITTRAAGQANSRREGAARTLRAAEGSAGNAAGASRQNIIISGIVGPDGAREFVSSTDNPLIVIDGVIQSEDVTLRDVGPGKLDIESVEILKGTEAVEKYGERARGGVIEYTTKGGARDRGEEDPRR